MSLTFFTPAVVSVAVLGTVLSAQIDRLGSPRYSTREAAFAALRQSGALGADLARKALTHPDPEVRRRCEVIVREFEATSAGRIKPTGYDFYPWLTSLPKEIDQQTVEGKI